MVFFIIAQIAAGRQWEGHFFLFLWGTWRDAWFFACFAALAKKPSSDWAGDAKEFVKKGG